MDDLTHLEREHVLIALWNYKVAIGEANANTNEATTEHLVAVMDVTDIVDSAARKLGGQPELPLYGVGTP